MEISDKNLEDFRMSMLERGLVPDTAALYVLNVKTCAAAAKGITSRLVAGKLAPNTLRTNLAALRAWARFADDTALLKRLQAIRLPPARRVRTKQPLSLDDLKRVVRHLKTCRMTNEAMRQVILIIAIRGLRSGDVLRLQRAELESALSTGKLVYEGKGRKRIEIAAGPIREQLEALVAMKGWKRVRDLIAVGAGTSRVISKKVCRAAKRTAKKIGILEMNPHRYRHTFATNFLKQLHGDPNAIVKLQRYMAWESLNTASRYVDAVSQAELDEIGDRMMEDITR